MPMYPAIVGKSALPIKILLASTPLFLLGFCGINVARATVVVSANITQTVVGSPNTYSITVTNNSTSGEAVSAFWFAGTSGQNYLSISPTNVTAPPGWTFSITHEGSGDGYGIAFSTSSAQLAAKNALAGFTFQSSSSISQLQGKSTFFPTTQVLTSVVVTGSGAVETPVIATFQAKLIIFGDSLSDVGNAYNAGYGQMGVLLVPPNYTLGKYTDGPDTTPSSTKVGNWADQLAALLGVPDPTPSSAGGGDYAYGGAQTGTGSPPGLGSQVSFFLYDFPSPSPNSIYVLWGGANDLIKAPNAAALPAAEATAISNLKAEIGQLANADARNFVWFNLPPIGSVPVGVQSGYPAALNSASAQFSSDLSAAIPQLETSYPGISITEVDAYSLLNQIIANPSAYGLTNVTGEALGASVNPDTYLFWDIEHPTTVGHGLIAQFIFNATPKNDGIPGLLKYLFDINPLAPVSPADRAALPQIGIDTTSKPGTHYLTLTYRQYSLATGVTVNLQSSPDLKTWTTVVPDINQQVGIDSATHDPIMEVGVIATGTRLFLRLNVTRP